jgi:hypothetical protein
MPYGGHRGKRLWSLRPRKGPKASTTTYRVARASPGWNQWLKRGLCIQLEPVLPPPPVNCRPQVYCKGVRPRTGRYLFGAFYKTMEGKYGHHNTSDHHRCAAVARRRLVWPRAVVLVSLPTISEQSIWRSVMMRPGCRSYTASSKAAGPCARLALRRLQNWKLCRSRQSTRMRSNGCGFDRSAIHTLICMQFRSGMAWVWFNRG